MVAEPFSNDPATEVRVNAFRFLLHYPPVPTFARKPRQEKPGRIFTSQPVKEPGKFSEFYLMPAAAECREA